MLKFNISEERYLERAFILAHVPSLLKAKRKCRGDW